MRLRLFQLSLYYQASNWLEHLPIGSISTWEDLTTRFLAQFFPSGRTTKLRNDILMLQQHHVQIFYDHVNSATRHAIDHSTGGKLCDKRAKESWELIENLALYDHESWNDPRDLAKSVKAISLPQDVSMLIVGIKSLLEVTAAKISLLEDMDSEYAHMVAASKVPMLKPGEFEILRMRIEQYIQMIDYALWKVIENGNITPKSTVVEGVEKIIPPTTAEEKA
ncbi:zinc finger, CCHC-type containing protein [Tanacetum coccineum]